MGVFSFNDAQFNNSQTSFSLTIEFRSRKKENETNKIFRMVTLNIMFTNLTKH